jgi:hypothetical protein
MPRDCDCSCHYDLEESVREFIDSLGALDAYQTATAETALSLARSMSTALAAAPVAKELRSTLEALRDEVGPKESTVSPFDELANRRRERASGE